MGFGGDADQTDFPPLTQATARPHFEEVRKLAAADDGALWGVNIYGPLLLVDPHSRVVVANESDLEGILEPVAGLYTGTLPDGVGVANTATHWAGKYWTMVMWPLPADRYARQTLLAHELWHRIQDQLDLPMVNAPNLHLGTLEGRLWLQLEWRALARALTGRDDTRNMAMADALAFRAYRRTLFPAASDQERSLEMHEGLAEYTGFALSGRDLEGNLQEAANQLAEAESSPSFVRSFAYASGPAYGLLLDIYTSNWRQKLSKEDDLGELLAQQTGFVVPADLEDEVDAALSRYNGPALVEAEELRDQARQERLADYRRRFVEGPVLILDFYQMSVEFDPREVDALDNLGNVYPSLRLTDDWGVLVATGGAFITSDWQVVIVPAPADPDSGSLQGEGYTLELAAGWNLVPAERAGDFRLGAVATSE